MGIDRPPMEDMEQFMHDEKDSLVKEYLELLKKTETDPERMVRFNDPQWQKDVTVENLKILIKGSKELLDAQDRVFEMLRPKTKEDKKENKKE